MNRAHKISIGALITAVVGLVAILLLPAPPTWRGDWGMFHLPLALTFASATFHVGAAILFLTGVKFYKGTLRQAYIVLSISSLMVAVGTLQSPFINGFDLWQTFWVTNGFVVLPFLLSSSTLYFGARQLSKSLGIHSVLSRALVVVPVVIAASAAITLLPHPPIQTPELTYDFSNFILMWVCLMQLAAALMALRVRGQIGSHYVNAVAWLAVALLAGFLVMVVLVVHGLLTDATQDLVYMLVYAAGTGLGLLWIKAALAFNKTGDV